MAVYLTTDPPDPAEGVKFYEVDGVNIDGQKIPAQPDGSLKVEVDGLEPGDYTAQIHAGNEWGLSSPLPFLFNVPKPLTPPTGPKLVEG